MASYFEKLSYRPNVQVNDFKILLKKHLEDTFAFICSFVSIVISKLAVLTAMCLFVTDDGLLILQYVLLYSYLQLFKISGFL